jgi:hypothetical protein
MPAAIALAPSLTMAWARKSRWLCHRRPYLKRQESSIADLAATDHRLATDAACLQPRGSADFTAGNAGGKLASHRIFPVMQSRTIPWLKVPLCFAGVFVRE